VHGNKCSSGAVFESHLVMQAIAAEIINTSSVLDLHQLLLDRQFAYVKSENLCNADSIRLGICGEPVMQFR
jgi:hypothetical protein